MEDRKQQAVVLPNLDAELDFCECGHVRENHRRSRKCQAQGCACQIFLSPHQKRMLERLHEAQANVKPGAPRPQPVRLEACDVCRAAPVEATTHWPEPLCEHHYRKACDQPPRAVLTFADGHREMRRNYVYPRVYRDVDQDDGEDGDVRVTWFKHTDTDHTPDGRVLMQFYSEIPAPVDALGKPKTADSTAENTRQWESVHGWRRKARAANRRARIIGNVLSAMELATGVALAVLLARSCG